MFSLFQSELNKFCLTAVKEYCNRSNFFTLTRLYQCSNLGEERKSNINHMNSICEIAAFRKSLDSVPMKHNKLSSYVWLVHVHSRLHDAGHMYTFVDSETSVSAARRCRYLAKSENVHL